MTTPCNCPSDGLSDFDRGMLASFEDGAVAEMGDTITLGGNTIPCVVSSRVVSKKNIQGGTKSEVSATIEVARADFIRAGGNKMGGDLITFSDGLVGKIASVDDGATPLYTLNVGPRLEGSAGPNGGQW